MIKKRPAERAFDILNVVVMVLLSFIFLYPYVNQLAISLNNAADTAKGGLYFYPRALTFENYKMVFENSQFGSATVVSVTRVLVGTFLALFVTYSAAYALSKKSLPGRMGFTTFLLIPMFISGGLIPTYVLYRELHIMNSFLVYVLPGMFSFYNMIIMRTFLSTIPGSLEESVTLDGANSWQVMIYIYVPLSTPVIATVTLWLAVGHWNDWTSTLYFIQSKGLHTLQYMMYRLLKESDLINQMVAERQKMGMAVENTATITPQSIKATTLIVSTLPIVCVYPFLQRYFVKGIMIGAIKE